jgi:DNA-binding PadR family transcriptional regulator
MSRSLGEFEQLLLYAVLRLGDAADSVSIRQEIERRTGRAVSAGAVYTGFARLERRGLVSSRAGTATPERGGRRRKYYGLRPEGAASLYDTWENLDRISEGLVRKLRALAAVHHGKDAR